MSLRDLNSDKSPLILTLAGMEQPGPGHWLSQWEASRDDMARVNLGQLGHPRRNSWVLAINQAIRQADRPVLLVARGLACLAVAWWAALERPAYGDPVVGALLVAPPDVDATSDLRLIGFGPAPKAPLPFPSVVVASQNDRRMDFAGAQALARFWGSQLVDGGEIGSANGQADLGGWDHGRHMLHWLEEQVALGTGRPAPHSQPSAQVIDFVQAQHPGGGVDLSL